MRIRCLLECLTSHQTFTVLHSGIKSAMLVPMQNTIDRAIDLKLKDCEWKVRMFKCTLCVMLGVDSKTARCDSCPNSLFICLFDTPHVFLAFSVKLITLILITIVVFASYYQLLAVKLFSLVYFIRTLSRDWDLVGNNEAARARQVTTTRIKSCISRDAKNTAKKWDAICLS